MHVFGLTWQFNAVGKYPPADLSPKERDRVRALILWQETQDVSLVGRTFGVSLATLYRWRQRFDPREPTSLRERSRRPHRRRQPQWSLAVLQAVRRLRQQYPRWGKDKLVVLLHREGVTVSTSTVGRILTRLKTTGQLREPRPRAVSAKKRRAPRPYAVRKPKGYTARQPGDLVQIDTLDVRPLPGVVLKHFTARDVVSRWDVLEAHHRATASGAAQFLQTLHQRMPFPIRSIQVDGGSEFCAAFEAECQRRGIHLFVLPPKSPKLNGAVERAQRTHTEEFYEVTDCSWQVGVLNRELVQWEQTYNTIRPHQALGYLTPLQFLRQHSMLPLNRPSPSHM